jgi:hypothetical protein
LSLFYGVTGIDTVRKFFTAINHYPFFYGIKMDTLFLVQKNGKNICRIARKYKICPLNYFTVKKQDGKERSLITSLSKNKIGKDISLTTSLSKNKIGKDMSLIN